MLHSHTYSDISALLSAPYVDQRADVLNAYANDMSGIAGCAPIAVAFPSTTAEVSEFLQAASNLGVPVFPRGAGTGLAGGAVPSVTGGIVLSTEKLNEIVAFDAQNGLMNVQSGVVTGRVSERAAEHGFFFPAAPNSSAYASVGGNVLHDSSGPRSYKYGSTRQFVHEVEVVTGTGEILRLGDKYFKHGPGYDLLDLVIGSEGTLGVVTEIWLKLLPEPFARTTLILEFSELSVAFQAVEMLHEMQAPIAAIDLVGQECLPQLQQHAELDVLSKFADHLILVEFEDDQFSNGAWLEHAIDKLKKYDCLHHVETDLTRQKEIWGLRAQIFGLMKSKYQDMRVEDICVPVAYLADFGGKIGDHARSLGVNWTAIGNVGEGNLHVAALDAEESTQGATGQQSAFLSQVVETSLDLAGQMSFEHGIGLKKKDTFASKTPAALRKISEDIKTAMDPMHILNPEKIFGASVK